MSIINKKYIILPSNDIKYYALKTNKAPELIAEYIMQQCTSKSYKIRQEMRKIIKKLVITHRTSDKRKMSMPLAMIEPYGENNAR